MVYVPATDVFTVPDTVTVSPPSEVAPASVQAEPCSTVSVPDVTVITGAVVSGTSATIRLSICGLEVPHTLNPLNPI